MYVRTYIIAARILPVVLLHTYVRMYVCTITKPSDRAPAEVRIITRTLIVFIKNSKGTLTEFCLVSVSKLVNF